MAKAFYRKDGGNVGVGPFKVLASIWFTITSETGIQDDELEWLKADLQDNEKPVIVFAHQRLDVSNSHGVKNNAEVRKVLESSGKVLAVFQGHSHQNDLNEIGGIHYCTLVAMVEGSGAENNGYSVIEIEATGTIHLTGFRKQRSYKWERQGVTMSECQDCKGQNE